MEKTGRTLFIFSIRIKGITNERASSGRGIGHFSYEGGRIKESAKGHGQGIGHFRMVNDGLPMNLKSPLIFRSINPLMKDAAHPPPILRPESWMYWRLENVPGTRANHQ